jgi:DNA-directed RNA polymerase subunit omega
MRTCGHRSPGTVVRSRARATTDDAGSGSRYPHPHVSAWVSRLPAEHSTVPLRGDGRDMEGILIARIDDLMDKVDSKFHLVHLAAKRAREINAYYSQLGEGLGQQVPPLVSTESNKALSIALEEIAQSKVEGIAPTETTSDDPLAFIGGDDQSA